MSLEPKLNLSELQEWFDNVDFEVDDGKKKAAPASKSYKDKFIAAIKNQIEFAKETKAFRDTNTGIEAIKKRLGVQKGSPVWFYEKDGTVYSVAKVGRSFISMFKTQKPEEPVSIGKDIDGAIYFYETKLLPAVEVGMYDEILNTMQENAKRKPKDKVPDDKPEDKTTEKTTAKPPAKTTAKTK